MMRYRLPIWLALVAIALAYVAIAGWNGTHIRSNLLALLSDESRDPVVEASKQRVKELSFQKAVFLVGHAEPTHAIKAAEALAHSLTTSQNFQTVTLRPDSSGMAALLSAFQTHGQGLLSSSDRAALTADQGQNLAQRALGSVFAGLLPVPVATLENDPFLLLHSYLAALPNPAPLLRMRDGILLRKVDGMTWIYLDTRIKGDPLSLSIQKQVADAVTRGEAALPTGTMLLRTGAVFFARAGADAAMMEAGTIGGVSILGVIILLVVVFRGVGPLLMNVAAIAIGIICAAASVIALFDSLHVITLLMGTSLIGVSVDYGLHYCCGRFGAGQTPQQRLPRILPGLTLGLATTLIGYACLAIAPLPGLRQVAVFTVVGLGAAFISVVILFPAVDRAPQRAAPAWLSAIVAELWRIADRGWFRWAAPVLILAIALPGIAYFTANDDVRRLQKQDGDLLRQQRQIEGITGFAPQGHYLLIDAPDTESALRAEEDVGKHLDGMVASGILTGWRGLSQWVPSTHRQNQNRRLVSDRLEQPFLAAHRNRLGLSAAPDGAVFVPLTLEGVAMPKALGSLILVPGQHLVFPGSIKNPDELASLMSSNTAVQYVNPTADVTSVLQRYRERALMLLAVTIALTYLLLMWRYGWRGGLAVLAPPMIAVVAAPLIASYAGAPMTMFSVLAMILVFSIGGDYAIFCREADRDHRAITLMAVLCAAMTTWLSFGLLAASSVAAVHEFGLTMIIGTAIAVMLAPTAQSFKSRHKT
ncbi:MAG: hypothetical protein HOM62_12930 [Rhodospirillaceae bacterium]|nr:hypothetical protein [Rhodospirillaceae bacterium]